MLLMLIIKQGNCECKLLSLHQFFKSKMDYITTGLHMALARRAMDPEHFLHDLLLLHLLLYLTAGNQIEALFCTGCAGTTEISR